MDKTVIFALPVALLIVAGAWFLTQSSVPQQIAPQGDVYGYNTEEGTMPQGTVGGVSTASAQAQTGMQDPVPTSATSSSQVTSDNNLAMQATFHTTKGDITIEFLGADAPNTVANFTKLAKEGLYNGTKFHRVISGFMIQGGDPLSKDDALAARWGTGGPGYQFADEIHANNRNAVGTIAMANSGPNTNGSQFFINTADNNFLDPKHTVFGKVTAGLDVVKAIETTATGPNDRPLEAMVITSVEIK